MYVKDKFYVGSREIGTSNGNGYARPTSKAAVAHAKRMLIEDPTRPECIIVKIVGVVRRRPQFNIEKAE